MAEPVWPSSKALGWEADTISLIPLYGSPCSSNVVYEQS